MFDQTGWVILGAAVVLAALLGFVVGRMGGGSSSRVSELESEVARQKDELSGYKREVEAHFDKTAALFVSMAGSYKELIEHLSSSYHRLGEDGTRELFRDRVNSLLVAEAADEGARDMDAVAEPAPRPPAETEGVEAAVAQGGDGDGASSVEVAGEPQAPAEGVADVAAAQDAATADQADTASSGFVRKDG